MKALKTKTEYRAALKEVEMLMGAQLNTSAGKRLDFLVTLIEAYERQYYRILQENNALSQKLTYSN